MTSIFTSITPSSKLAMLLNAEPDKSIICYRRREKIKNPAVLKS
jgi:hypothetical protein